MKQAEKRLRILAVFTFVLAPLFSWGSVIATDETAVTRNLPEHDLKNPSEHGYCLFKNCCAIIRFIAERTPCHDWMQDHEHRKLKTCQSTTVSACGLTETDPERKHEPCYTKRHPCYALHLPCT